MFCACLGTGPGLAPGRSPATFINKRRKRFSIPKPTKPSPFQSLLPAEVPRLPPQDLEQDRTSSTHEAHPPASYKPAPTPKGSVVWL